MIIEQFSADSPISGIRVRYASDRSPTAFISVGEGVTAEQISAIRRILDDRKWHSVPVFVDGREVLQVDGFENADQLAELLKNHRFALGNPNITAELGDHAKRSIGKRIGDNGIRIGGGLNLVGDLTLLGAGVKGAWHGREGSAEKIAAGGFYTLGAAVAGYYGNVKTEHHVRQVIEKTAESLKNQAGKLPENCGLEAILRDRRKGVIHDLESFLYRYPADTMLAAYTLGAMCMLRAGMKSGNKWTIGYGVSSLAVKATSLLIPEKKKNANDKPASTLVGRFIDKIHGQPLLVFGLGSLVTDVLLSVSALRDKKGVDAFTLFTSGTYIMADVLMAISHKSHINADGKFDADEQRRIVGLFAEALANKPEAERNQFADHVAGILSIQPEITGTAPEISQAIKEQMAHMQKNPWARHVSATPSSPSMQY